MTLRLALHGATGRMGTTLARLVRDAKPGEWSLVGAVAAPSDPGLGRDLGELAGLGSMGVAVTGDVASALLGADVVIDFSLAAAVTPLAAAASRAGVALVSGTTNLGEAERAALARAAERIPVLSSANMSFGVQVLAELVEAAVRRLGPAYDAEILEVHHRRKVDAPSGTARRLVAALSAARPGLTELHGRSGEVGARTDGEVGVFGVRGGDVIGEHTVYLLGPGERLELTHRATSRDLFAHGALRAAAFLHGKPPGLYTLADVSPSA